MNSGLVKGKVVSNGVYIGTVKGKGRRKGLRV